MRLAIADPPYPPMFGERFDTASGDPRLTMRSRSRRWYGDQGVGRGGADVHDDAGKWDDLSAHRQLIVDLMDNFDGWAIATTPDGIGAYHPLPVSARIMAWVRPNAAPGGGRLLSKWEPVIVFVPEARRARGLQVSDVLIAGHGVGGFAGAKPPEWTRWVLDALGYQHGADDLHDIFPGSGAVSHAADGLLAFDMAE